MPGPFRSLFDHVKHEVEDAARSAVHELGDDVASAEARMRGLAETVREAADRLARGESETVRGVARELEAHLREEVGHVAEGLLGQGAEQAAAAAVSFLVERGHLHGTLAADVEQELAGIAKALGGAAARAEGDVGSLVGGSVAELIAEVAALLVFDVEGRRWLPRVLLRFLGAGDAPGVPLVGLRPLLDTILRLRKRTAEMAPAHKGLADVYHIGGLSLPGFTYLFGGADGSTKEADARRLASTLAALDPEDAGNDVVATVRELRVLAGALAAPPPARAAAPPAATPPAAAPPDPTTLALTDVDQWTIGWTRFAGIRERGFEPRVLLSAPADAPPSSSLAGEFASALDPARPDVASALFWPILADYGTPYNLLILEKVTPGDLGELENLFGAAWDADWAAAAADGDLYQIDLRLFEDAPYDTAANRMTPATVTLLRRSGAGDTWALTPVAVRVSGPHEPACYVESDGAWVWALQAARASATTFGIWIGHVYHWHIVTAAALQALPAQIADPEKPMRATHPVGQILAPQGQWLREFDEALLALWSGAAPPTSFTTPQSFLRLLSRYAAGRSFFADDPIETLEANGFGDTFTTETPTAEQEDWRRHFPAPTAYLTVWNAAREYVDACVEAWYPTDADVADDKALQTWLANARSPDGGNLHGLDATVETRAYLARILTSLIYRVTVHGVGRLLSTANPGLTYVANFPPCLQPPAPDAAFPDPAAEMTAAEVFAWMPRTGTIGGMFNFYGTFSFSNPYEPFIPFEGIDKPRFTPRGPDTPPGTVEASNRALMRFREAIRREIDVLDSPPAPGLPPRYQWPLSIET